MVTFYLTESAAMTIRFECFTGNTSGFGALVALNYGLYVKGWCLFPELVAMARDNKHGSLIIGYDYDIPVSVFFIERSMHVMAFVKPEYRGQGIGKAMVDFAMKSLPKLDWTQRYAREGVSGSVSFWKSCKVCMEEDAYALSKEDLDHYKSIMGTNVISEIQWFANVIYENKRRLNGLIT